MCLVKFFWHAGKARKFLAMLILHCKPWGKKKKKKKPPSLAQFLTSLGREPKKSILRGLTDKCSLSREPHLRVSFYFGYNYKALLN